jgi:hypothetical protein
MTVVSKRKPYRVGRSRTGLGLFATREIEKGTRIVEYFGPLLDCSKPEHDAIENKYLFELNGRWTIDGSVRRNIARYANHACRPNAESDVYPRLKKVYIRAIKKIRPGDEITYDYGTDYFREYLKPIGCKCVSCETKRKAARAEERARKKRAAARRRKRALNGHGANGHAANDHVANGQAAGIREIAPPDGDGATLIAGSVSGRDDAFTAPAGPEILQFSQHADRDRLRRDEELAQQVRRQPVAEQQRKAR